MLLESLLTMLCSDIDILAQFIDQDGVGRFVTSVGSNALSRQSKGSERIRAGSAAA